MWPKRSRVYLQDLFQSRFIRMSLPTPRRLLELACQSLLRDEALAMSAVEMLPAEIFPPLFMAAFAGKHDKILKMMVQSWPFPCLPLGALMKDQQPHQETFQAVLDGLDALLAQEVRPRRWKLQVLNLQKDAHQEFWTVWSGTRAAACSLMETETTQSVGKRQKVESSRAGSKPPLAPVEVFIDLSLKEGAPDESLSYLIKKVSQGRGLLHLCCKKLKIFAVSMQNINILKMVQLDSVQDLEVNCTWKPSTLKKFVPQLSQMGNLRRFLLSHILTSSHTTPAQEQQCVRQLTSQFLSLHHLQELCLDALSFLEGRLHQVLRCLQTPLEALSITNCSLSENDFAHLCQNLNVSQLKGLSFSGLNLTNMSSGPLQLLIERASATLQDLDLDECGIMDPEITDILPALSLCSELTTFSFCENPISMSVLEELLRHTIGLSKLNHVLYAAPIESYEELTGTLHLGRLAQVHTTLRQLLQDLGRPDMVWFSASPCPHCGDRTFYDPNPILCPCYMSV
ncbi:PRAME nuclear receptor transcriptional regulator [Phyllostomus discolor]|uniref:PRAME nuclear receptor transcriptional regulator n=1 Tax=Phyllostomus discolor TaxID=89673 RepID=A0A834DLV8_9CHIR|nr:PRAME nuclear receptor transcriptional regulator [Phyllostomus discolor]